MAKNRTVPFLLAVLLSLLPACARRSEESRIEEALRRMADLAEDRDLDGLMDRFAPDYADFEGRDRARARELIGGYFAGRSAIVVHLLRTDVKLEGGNRAAVQAEAALSSGAAEVFRKLFRSFGELYRFDLEMAKPNEEWKVAFARWRSIGPEELSPGARSILRKLFPD